MRGERGVVRRERVVVRGGGEEGEGGGGEEGEGDDGGEGGGVRLCESDISGVSSSPDLYELACRLVVRGDLASCLTVVRCMATLAPRNPPQLGAVLTRVMARQGKGEEGGGGGGGGGRVGGLGGV